MQRARVCAVWLHDSTQKWHTLNTLVTRNPRTKPHTHRAGRLGDPLIRRRLGAFDGLSRRGRRRLRSDSRSLRKGSEAVVERQRKAAQFHRRRRSPPPLARRGPSRRRLHLIKAQPKVIRGIVLKDSPYFLHGLRLTACPPWLQDFRRAARPLPPAAMPCWAAAGGENGRARSVRSEVCRRNASLLLDNEENRSVVFRGGTTKARR